MSNKPSPVELTYYEELGVAPGASADQVEKAYKRLAGVLHPDRHNDPQLRLALENQMRRLNGIAGVLRNSAAREAYDRNCRSSPPPPARPVPDWSLAVAASLLASALTFALSGDPNLRRNRAESPPLAGLPSSVGQAAEEPGSHAQIIQSRKPAGAAKPLRPPTNAQPWNGRPTLALGPETTVWHFATPAEPDIPPPALQEITVPTPPVDTPPVAPPPTTYAGSWFYTGSRSPARGLYAPEYIQLELSETDRRVSGTYRGRFQIPDRPLAPDVEFRLEGTQAGPSASFHWTGAAGAKGEGTLRLVTDKRIEVQWYATEPGRDPGLGAAVAVLTRKARP